MSNLTSVVSQLEQERSRIQSQLQSIQNAIAALRRSGTSTTASGMSAAGRARIAAAQRARWARVKAQKGGSWVDAQSGVAHFPNGISMSVVWAHAIVNGDWYPWFPEVIGPATAEDWGTTDLFPTFGMSPLS